MAHNITNFVPKLSINNYKEWKQTMTAFLQSYDPWLVVNGTWLCPVLVNAAASTEAERTAEANWLSANS